jgi:hypothetical protein
MRAGWLGCPRPISSSFIDGDLEKKILIFFPPALETESNLGCYATSACAQLITPEELTVLVLLRLRRRG